MKLKKFEGNPILSPLDSNDWESLVTCNPEWFMTMVRSICCTELREMMPNM